MFEIIAYEILLEAASPIHHGAETFGNHATIVRRKVRQPDGSFADVPALSGDCMRHGLREAAAMAFLDAAGLLDAGQLTEAALRLLFAGGMVTGNGSATDVRIDRYREMVDLVPPLALLGGCAGNRVIPGRMVSEDAVLICDESRAAVPAWMFERAGTVTGARGHVEIHQRVRMDPTLNPAKRQLLASTATQQIEARLRKSEEASETDDAIAKDDAKSSMLPRTFEAVCTGSLWSWRVQATAMSEIETDTFHAMLGSFLSRARVGGKQGTGFGALRAVAANAVAVHRPAQSLQAVDVTALGPRVGERFRAHVRERADRIRTWLGEVDA